MKAIRIKCFHCKDTQSFLEIEISMVGVFVFIYAILYHQESMKEREVIPHIGPIPIVIPLKLFLEGIDFLADNVTSRVT